MTALRTATRADRTDRSRWGRLVRSALAGTVTVAALVAGVLGGTPAWAGDTPDALTIEGTGLSRPISLSVVAQQDLFGALLRQVSWMAGRTGDPINPDPATLGPKYTVTVLAGHAPVQVYDLYPQAAGGPRAHRPAAQPTSRTSDAWFFVSVSIPEILQAAGVPLNRTAATGAPGAMTYDDPAGYVPAAVRTTAPALSLGKTLSDQGRTLLVWMGTPLLVLLLIFPVARRSRRYSPRQVSR